MRYGRHRRDSRAAVCSTAVLHGDVLADGQRRWWAWVASRHVLRLALIPSPLGRLSCADLLQRYVSSVSSSRQDFAHDRLCLAEAFALIDGERVRVAGRDVALDDGQTNTIRPRASQQRSGKPVPAPGVFDRESFHFDPVAIPPQARIATDRGQDESA